MKLRKTKRTNTVEFYASCTCAMTTCRCTCNSVSNPSSASFDNAYLINYYDSNTSSMRG